MRGSVRFAGYGGQDNADVVAERVVHARGAGAFGEFKLHTPLTGITTAKILTDTSKTSPAYVRFSTVNGSRGSGDTVSETSE